MKICTGLEWCLLVSVGLTTVVSPERPCCSPAKQSWITSMRFLMKHVDQSSIAGWVT